MPLLRKDLKLGFLAGAVLLVLAVAYALVLTFSGPGTPSRESAGAGPVADPSITGEQDALPQAPAGNAGGPTDGQPRLGPEMLSNSKQAPATDWSVYGFKGNAPIITKTPDPASSGAALGGTEQQTAIVPQIDAVPRQSAASESEAVDLQFPVQDGGPSTRTHVVAGGESFSSIAQKYYGDANLYTLIQKANPQVDSSRMKVGQKLWIPDQEAAKQPAEQPAQQRAPGAGGDSGGAGASADAASYTVQPGDTLELIASRRLGRRALWEEIYKLNRDLIGADPARLKVGMKLKLPQ